MLPLMLTFVAAGPAAPPPPTKPICLHPDNPHYLLFRGKPTVLVTSGEHYGAVLNLDFDYKPYLAELKRCRLNQTRTFSGVYCEAAGSFKIRGNPLAPKKGRLICPWARSDKPGYAAGGNKFDLTKWDPAYVARLRDFVNRAGKAGVVVELVLFCPFYKDEMWNLSPMNARNNVNGIGEMKRTSVYTRKNKKMLAVHKAVTQHIVRALAGFDNVYFEVCNEPYFGGVTIGWQDEIIAAIVEAEKDLPHKHLIAQNVANGRKRIARPNPAVSIFNFHYANPPDTVAMNYHLNKVIGDDETGFRGSSDFVYRAEGWEFLLAGGGEYSNLDYSFTPDREDGSAKPNAPGGGGRALRAQLCILKDFIEWFQFTKMKPMPNVVLAGVPDKGRIQVLGEAGVQYAVYIRGVGRESLVLDLPAGKYRATWIDTKTAKIARRDVFEHKGRGRTIHAPAYREDIALAVRRLRED